MEYPIIITINEESIKSNLKFLKDYVGKDVKISSVVKANAYGHGIKEYVPIAEKCGIDHFSVFSYNEAIQVYTIVKKTTSIMIMGWIGDEYISDAITKGIEFYIFTIERLKIALKMSEKLGISAKIHLEVETGMNRTGLSKKEFNDALKIINANKQNFQIKGICSHLSGPESIANHVRVKRQISNFKTFVKIMNKNNIFSEYTHLANSAATISYPSSKFNMVRIGIMQYGFWSSKETFLRYSFDNKDLVNPLERIISMKSQVMSIKRVKKGEFVSYSTIYLAQNDVKIAVVPIGYSNGYSRSFTNRGRILIRGTQCSVIGSVNMNMIIVDVTGIDDVKIGDEAVLIGSQNDLVISVDSFSEITQQINYEILSRLSINIPRKIIKSERK
ncbi:MAG: alanine racemase [Candidatus Delongbacteria bacterium]|jgi:alanine racemase|nr:alanine racemase [Candidatus Delongbacteria bacterium]